MNLRTLLRRVEQIILSRSAYKFLLSDWSRIPDLAGLNEVLASTRSLRSLRPVVLDCPKAQRILVIAPHEDDEMIGPGGTLIKAIAAGAEVRVVYLTTEANARGAVRRAETEAVSRRVGYATEFLGYPADALPVGAESGARLAATIARFAPQIIFVPFVSDDHPDHRKASLVLLEASQQGMAAGGVEVWAYQVYAAVLPNVVVDITAVHTDKAAAIRTWQSAMASRDWAHFALGLNAYNARLLAEGNDRRFVEAFFVVPLADYLALTGLYARRAG